jgi:hypothetical protein
MGRHDQVPRLPQASVRTRGELPPLRLPVPCAACREDQQDLESPLARVRRAAPPGRGCIERTPRDRRRSAPVRRRSRQHRGRVWAVVGERLGVDRRRDSESHTFRNLVLLIVLVGVILSVTGNCGTCHCNIDVTDNRRSGATSGSNVTDIAKDQREPDASVARHSNAAATAVAEARRRCTPRRSPRRREQDMTASDLEPAFEAASSRRTASV